MGKTANGAVWLNSYQLSDWDFWQYWRNTEDLDVIKFLKLFTELPISEIRKFENLPNGIGIMADDIAAGMFAFVTQAAILTSLNQNIYIEILWN